MRSTRKWSQRGVTLLLLVLAPLLMNDFLLFLSTEILVLGIVVASLGFLTGWTGMPSLGQAAYFGMGGYATALLAIHVTDLAVVQLLFAAVCGGVLAAATGWIAVRTKGIFFLMITLAFSELFHAWVQVWGDVTGGSNGLSGIPPISLFPGDRASLLLNDAFFYFYVLVAVLLAYAALRRVTDSPYGAVLAGIRENEARMRSLGFAVGLYKLGAFTLVGALAGYGGALLVQHVRFISPGDVAFDRSAIFLVMAIVGGVRTLYGPMIGAAAIVLLEHQLSTLFAEHWEMWLGGIFILAVYFLPEGIGGILQKAGGLLWPSTGVRSEAQQAQGTDARRQGAPTAYAATIGARTESLSKAYGALQAVTDVSLILRPGRTHALIGPNGAGKSTLFHLFAGSLAPSGGLIWLGEENVTRLPEHKRARLGLARMFQQPSIFPGVSAQENVTLALLRRAGVHWDLSSRLEKRHDLLGRADGLLQQVRLDEVALEKAGNLSHGQQRHLELAIGLASEPGLLLLDEPTAGMTPAEVVAFRALITQLPANLTILIVEHDMDVVFDLAEWVFVMNAGLLLEQGPPEQIKASAAVQEAYLGVERSGV